jgi:hypothetical protein
VPPSRDREHRRRQAGGSSSRNGLLGEVGQRRLDARPETFQSWAIPSGDLYAGIVRHMRADAQGRLLLHQGSTNRIIRATLPPAD